MQVEVRWQFGGVNFRLPPLHVFLGSNSGLQACTASPLYLTSLLGGSLSHISEGETVICPHSSFRLPGAGVRIFVALPDTPLQRQGL